MAKVDYTNWLESRIEDIVKFFFVILTLGVLLMGGHSIFDFDSKEYPFYFFALAISCAIFSVILHFLIDKWNKKI